MTPHTRFLEECAAEVSAQGANTDLQQRTLGWISAANAGRYSYHFTALGRPIIQYPQDMVAMQELIWQVRPDLIIETGIAHGGSLVMSASMLALLDYCNAVETHEMLDPKRPARRVLGIDIDIREHNRAAIEAHPMANRIEMIEGSSIDTAIIEQVHTYAKDFSRILISLDSNHTHDHVLAELEAYAPLTSVGSYCVVFDSLIEKLPEDSFPDRPWGRGDNPMTALHAYLENHPEFVIDKQIDDKLLISVAPNGYLRRER